MKNSFKTFLGVLIVAFVSLVILFSFPDTTTAEADRALLQKSSFEQPPPFEKPSVGLASPPSPDPTCSKGIRAGSICCHMQCGQCGGPGCSEFPGGKEMCCYGVIMDAGFQCNRVRAPCIVDLVGQSYFAGECTVPKLGWGKLKSSEKTVYFLRHGESLLDAKNVTDMKDPGLTSHGDYQCTVLLKSTPDVVFNLLVSSPLTPCLQTAVKVFDKEKETPWIILERLRERYGKHKSNQRSNMSKLKEVYPDFDYSDLPENPDELGQEGTEEPESQLRDRVLDFFTWLSKRSEDRIVVVSHVTWLEQVFYFMECEKKFTKSYMHNAEMREIKLKF